MLIDFTHLARVHKVKLSDVLHLGANTGQEADTYRRLGAHRVFWVEAIPSVYRQLCRHIENKFHNQFAFNACVSDTTGKTVKFNIASNEGQSSSFLEFGTHSAAHPTVKFVDAIELVTITVEDLLKQKEFQLNYGTFLNIDLQGAELLALKGMANLMDRVNYVYVEVNEQELYKGCPHVKEIDAFLDEHDFEPKDVKMTGWGWGDKFYKRRHL